MGDPKSVAAFLEAVLAEAQAAGASDVHFRPAADALAMDWRTVRLGRDPACAVCASR